MDYLYQFIMHVPWWVFALFAYLVLRGVKARQPGETSLAKVAIIPVLLTLLGLFDLWQLFGFGPSEVIVWLVTMAVGAGIGWVILRDAVITVDRAKGTMHRPADLTVLPLVIVIFVVKFAFGTMAAVAPDLIQQPLFRWLDIGSSGLFAGIFVGKFGVYASRWFGAPATA